MVALRCTFSRKGVRDLEIKLDFPVGGGARPCTAVGSAPPRAEAAEYAGWAADEHARPSLAETLLDCSSLSSFKSKFHWFRV